MVGLYLQEDRPLFDWEELCPTPPELLEPVNIRPAPEETVSEHCPICEHREPILADLLKACKELMPILRERLHWRLLVPGERKLILRIEAAIAKATRQQ